LSEQPKVINRGTIIANYKPLSETQTYCQSNSISTAESVLSDNKTVPDLCVTNLRNAIKCKAKAVNCRLNIRNWKQFLCLYCTSVDHSCELCPHKEKWFTNDSFRQGIQNKLIDLISGVENNEIKCSIPAFLTITSKPKKTNAFVKEINSNKNPSLTQQFEKAVAENVKPFENKIPCIDQHKDLDSEVNGIDEKLNKTPHILVANSFVNTESECKANVSIMKRILLLNPTNKANSNPLLNKRNVFDFLKGYKYFKYKK